MRRRLFRSTSCIQLAVCWMYHHIEYGAGHVCETSSKKMLCIDKEIFTYYMPNTM